jgi:hypothetical protein
MPLDKSGSDKALSTNIAREIKSGRKKDQAVAIAYSVQRKAKRETKRTSGNRK